MTDRFFNSDGMADPVAGATAGNAASGPGAQYEGGDLIGLKMKLPYLAGLGISAMPVDLVSDELASGELIALRERPPLPKVGYSAAYVPSNTFKIVPLIVAYAKEESRLSGNW